MIRGPRRLGLRPRSTALRLVYETACPLTSALYAGCVGFCVSGRPWVRGKTRGQRPAGGNAQPRRWWTGTSKQIFKTPAARENATPCTPFGHMNLARCNPLLPQLMMTVRPLAVTYALSFPLSPRGLRARARLKAKKHAHISKQEQSEKKCARHGGETREVGSCKTAIVCVLHWPCLGPRGYGLFVDQSSQLVLQTRPVNYTRPRLSSCMNDVIRWEPRDHFL